MIIFHAQLPFCQAFWQKSALFAAIGLTVILGCSALSMATEAGLPAEQLELLTDAIARIRSHALDVPASSRKMTEDILRAYTRSLDPYSDYLTAFEYAAFQESTSSDYFGVQMDLQFQDGRVLLFPFRGGLAEKSGIRAGDELLAVNGVTVYGKSLYVVGSTIRGEEGSTVQLTLRTGQALARSLSLRRTRAHYQSVHWHRGRSAHLVQITRFTQDTADQLVLILRQIHGDGRFLVLDLRGNQGGSLIDARRCADFFVEKATILFRLRDRDGIRAIAAEEPALISNPMVVLQDGATASAAEAFILALTTNGRARSAGVSSYGKGLAQRFLPLADGSALRLTYAEIVAPDGTSYHGHGLPPDQKLSRPLMEADLTKIEMMKSLLDRLQGKEN